MTKKEKMTKWGRMRKQGIALRTLLAQSRNKARLDLVGSDAVCKSCRKCLEDRMLDTFRKDANNASAEKDNARHAATTESDAGDLKFISAQLPW